MMYPIWYCSDHARDVRIKCMYTDAKIRICLVGMKVRLAKANQIIRLFCPIRLHTAIQRVHNHIEKYTNAHK